MAQRQHLQRRPDLHHLAHRPLVQRRHAHAAPRLADRQALGLQALEGLADGHMARPELMGDVVLAQRRIRRQLAGHDPLGQDMGDPVGDGLLGSVSLRHSGS